MEFIVYILFSHTKIVSISYLPPISKSESFVTTKKAMALLGIITIGKSFIPRNIIQKKKLTVENYKLNLGKFVLAKKHTQTIQYGKEFCYWAGEWIAFRGTQSINGSSWENQALCNFSNNSLLVMDSFNK